MPQKLFKRVEDLDLEADEVDGPVGLHVRVTVEATSDMSAVMLGEWAPDTPEGRQDNYLARNLFRDQEFPLAQEVYPALIMEFAHDLVMDVKEHGDRFEALYDATNTGTNWSAPNKNTGKTHQIHVYANAASRNTALQKLGQMKDCLRAEAISMFVEVSER